MQKNTARSSKSFSLRTRHRQRGVALLTTLLLLLLLTGLSLAMVLSVRSDLLINGYYRNFRGSFYGADSGLNIARQTMVNQILGAIPATFTNTTQPIPPGTDSTVQNYITSNYGQSYQPVTGAGEGQAVNSWPEKFKIASATLSLANCTVTGGNVGSTCAAPSGAVTGYQYIYNYTLMALGQAQGAQTAQLRDKGSLIVNALLVPAGTTTSFAAWGMFIDKYTICDGSTLVPGTISGPVFTNGAWNFGSSGSYIFTDTVGSASSQAGYQFKGACDQIAGNSDKKGSTTISPNFQSGFNRGQPSIPLPLNDYNQKRAVLDGMGSTNTAVTNSDLNTYLLNVNQVKYPSAGANTGVYLPYTVNAGGNNPTFAGGGIYVEGNASVTLTASGASTQVYTITQGSTITTINIDPTANGGAGSTQMISGGATLNIKGVPQQRDPATGQITGNAAMLYVNGSITSLSGPGQAVAAIQDHTALSITAANNVAITGDILYKTEPVTMTQNQIQGTPADTLIPANNLGQVLGIFTATGDIQLNNQQSNGNLQIDASLATISQNGTGGLVNTGNSINTLNIVGGRIQNSIKSIGATTRNVYFDRRFSQNFAPPWFPSTTVTAGGIFSAGVTTTVQRVQWVNQTSYF
ncbi:MAG TPA: hypothetical protein VNW97_03515 [Candidatus Saccharimonadales bacterium]|nr:hypothetical protein [Candidatus Saccharimonadales bacterium]